MKKIFLFGIILSMLVVFTGCQGTSPNENKVENTNLGTEQGTGKNNGTAIDSKYTLDYIMENLQAQNNVSLITASPNKKYVAYIVGYSVDKDLDEPPKLHIWQVGEASPVGSDIDELCLPVCELWWSPNEEYILVDIGSSTERVCDLFAAEGVKKIDSFGYSEGILFSPDGKRILFTGLSEEESIKANYIAASSINNLSLYDLESKKKQVLLAGTESVDYTAGEWIDNQIISYKKVEWKSKRESDDDDLSKETVYKYDLIGKQSTIDTEQTYRTYTNEIFGFSIDYPGYFGEGEGSTNGDGRSFISPDGSVSFKVWGERNDSGKTLQSVYEDLLNKHSIVLSENLNDNWLFVTWPEGDHIIREKHIVTDSLEYVLEIRYPDDAKEYEYLISRLTFSFKISQEPDY